MKKVIGYKGFHIETIGTGKMYCSPWGGKTAYYQIGKKTKVKGKISVCGNGLHFCKSLKDVLIYYSLKLSNVFCEVKSGKKVITKDKKSVSNSIKPLKLLSGTEVLQILGAKKLKTTGKLKFYDFEFGKFQINSKLAENPIEFFSTPVDKDTYYDVDIYSLRGYKFGKRETRHIAVYKNKTQ